MHDDLQVFTLTDRQALAKKLGPDPTGAAYLLADLEDPYFEHTRWFGAGRDPGGELVSIVLLYSALKDPAMLPYGEARGVGRILIEKARQIPDRVLGMIWPDQMEEMARFFDNPSGRSMIRMGLSKDSFIPCPGPDKAEALTWGDLGELTALMAHYPGNYFEPAMFREKLYYGVRLDGRLVSAGGIHTYSPTYGVAAIGNIVTHGSYRRRGLALSCTSTLVKALLEEEKVNHVALNVEAGNKAAISCYERLGFFHFREYIEGVFVKKDFS
ncbi:MAG: GNAT family N-acetyltransferase [Planctomycetota bacterium]